MKISSISRRFLFSHKSHSLVNLVAIVSVVALLVPTAAMIVVLSLQNGLSGMVHDTYAQFDSELRVTPRSGQFFDVDSAQVAEIERFADVSRTLETNVLAVYESCRTMATLRGVDSMFQSVSQLPDATKRGRWVTKLGETPRLMLGAGVGYSLAFALGRGEAVELSAIVPMPKALGFMGFSTTPVMATKKAYPEGVFTVDAQIDSKYIFTDIDFVRSLLSRPTQLSSLEIRPKIKLSEAKARVEEIMGADFVVQDRFMQRSSIFSAIATEKIVVFFVLVFVAIVAAMSLAGCTLMMTTEKAQSAAVLRSIGMSEKRLRGVFISLGMRVVAIGVTLGALFGVGLVLVQEYFKPLSAVGSALVEDNYPVDLSMLDVVATIFSMLAVGYMIVWLTVRSTTSKK